MAEFDPRTARKALKGTDTPDISRAVPGTNAGLSEEELMKKDFRYFLRAVWAHLNLPEPTPLQYNIAWWLQHGPDRAIIQAFRGVAKTWVTATFALWCLWCDPQFKVLVVSASKPHAVAVTNFALGLIRTMPLLKHMEPGPQQRQSTTGFDVRDALPDPAPSFSAAGITGQLPGKRANLIIPDDIETPINSATTALRETLRERVKEFDAIIKPGGRVVFLGTPQSQNSIYFELPSEVYTIRIWPAEYPNEELRRRYGARLAPFIAKPLREGKVKAGDPTEPTRFGADDLFKRKLSWGKSGFALQFMLDPTLSDVGMYPLKLRNFITMSLDLERGPTSVTWGNDERLQHKDLPVVGLDGDGYYKPASISDTTEPYYGRTMTIDPSGRDTKGSDELGWAAGAGLHGKCFVFGYGGYLHGYSPETLKDIADRCVRWNIQKLLVEDNFGNGMFTALLTPVLNKAWEDHNKRVSPERRGGTTIESKSSGRTQKELRIINVLEPAMGSHRVVLNAEAVREDYEGVKGYDSDRRTEYCLAHQLTNLTRDRDCLGHDDRVEALAELVAQFVDTMGVSPEDSAEQQRLRDIEQSIKELMREQDELQGSSQPPGPPRNRFARG